MMISTHNPHLHTSIPPTSDPTMLMSRVLNQPIKLSKPSSNHPSTAQMQQAYKIQSKSYAIKSNFKTATIYVDHVQGPKLSSTKIQ